MKLVMSEMLYGVHTYIESFRFVKFIDSEASVVQDYILDVDTYTLHRHRHIPQSLYIEAICRVRVSLLRLGAANHRLLLQAPSTIVQYIPQVHSLTPVDREINQIVSQ